MSTVEYKVCDYCKEKLEEPLFELRIKQPVPYVNYPEDMCQYQNWAPYKTYDLCSWSCLECFISEAMSNEKGK